MCSMLFRDEHVHLLSNTNNTFNLQVMSIVSTYVQDTQFAQQCVFEVTPKCVSISDTTCGWVLPEMIQIFQLQVGGQAVSHLLLGLNTPAYYVDIWVAAQTLHSLIIWFREKFHDVLLGKRVDETIIAVRPGVKCVCRVHVHLPGDPTPIMELQPDFTQCMMNGDTYCATPRCMLAIRSGTSVQPPHSPHMWMAHTSRLRLLHESEMRAKPLEIDGPSDSRVLLSDYHCVDICFNDTLRFCSLKRPKPPSRWIYMPRVEITTFLRSPINLVSSSTLIYVHVSRLHVRGRVASTIHIDHRDIRGIDKLVEHVNQTYPAQVYVRDEILIEETPIHAPSGSLLTAVPVGCSVSGHIWWYPQSLMSEHCKVEMILTMRNPRVHPGTSSWP